MNNMLKRRIDSALLVIKVINSLSSISVHFRFLHIVTNVQFQDPQKIC